MIRGTTPSITFVIEDEGFDFENIDDVWITVADYFTKKTYKHSEGNISIEPELKSISAILTQEDTLTFVEGNIDVQIRLVDKNGLAFASDIFKTTMKHILEGGVIGG